MIDVERNNKSISCYLIPSNEGYATRPIYKKKERLHEASVEVEHVIDNEIIIQMQMQAQ